MEINLIGKEQIELLDCLVMAIKKAAINGQPFTKTGGNGLYDRRSELPDELATVSRDRLVGMTDALLELGRLVLCVADGSKLKKWLDVPGGEFALGVGQFQIGSGPENSQKKAVH